MELGDFLENVEVFFMALGLILIAIPLITYKLIKFLKE